MSLGYLIDTSVISQFAPGQPAISDELSSWLRNQDLRLFLSATTIAEIEAGICKLRRAGGAQRAETLARWLDDLMSRFGDRILAIDAQVARIAGAISDAALSAGKHPGHADVYIGATARSHDLLLLTVNIRHFEAIEIDASDPFTSIPG